MMGLFKYLGPERTDVLENCCIRFTQAKDLNDPFEWAPFVKRLFSDLATTNFQERLSSLLSDKTSRKKLNINNLPAGLLKMIPQETKDEINQYTVKDALEKFSLKDLKELSYSLLSGNSKELNITHVLLNAWNNHFGVLSLTESCSNIPMWSHYAWNHAGFVIEFDPENQFFETGDGLKKFTRQVKPVHYTEKRQQINLIEGNEDIETILERIAKEIFFTKSKHWESEREVRILDLLTNHHQKVQFGDQEIFLFKFDPQAVKAVYFGVNCSADTQSTINQILNSDPLKHVKRLAGELDTKEYKIHFNALD